MRIGMITPGALPFFRGGAQAATQNTAELLARAGQEVHIFADTSRWMTDVRVGHRWAVNAVNHTAVSPDTAYAALRIFEPDIVFGYSETNTLGHAIARNLKVPFVSAIHDRNPWTVQSLAGVADLVVFAAYWIQEHYADDTCARSVVVRPPVFIERCGTTPGDAVTIVNITKGEALFRELATRMPEYKFLSVKGAWGHQMDGEIPPNIECVPTTQDMRTDVWSRTRVLVSPWHEEVCSVSAMEAMASGIPVVANDAPGLREPLGDAGTFCAQQDVDAWEREVRRLMSDEQAWWDASQRSRRRFAEFDPLGEIVRLVEAMEAVRR